MVVHASVKENWKGNKLTAEPNCTRCENGKVLRAGLPIFSKPSCFDGTNHQTQLTLALKISMQITSYRI